MANDIVVRALRAELEKADEALRGVFHRVGNLAPNRGYGAGSARSNAVQAIAYINDATKRYDDTKAELERAMAGGEEKVSLL